MAKQIIIIGAMLVFGIFILTGITTGPAPDPTNLDRFTASSPAQSGSLPADNQDDFRDEDLSGMFRSNRQRSGERSTFGNQGSTVGLSSRNANSTATSTALAYDSDSVQAGQDYANLPQASSSQPGASSSAATQAQPATTAPGAGRVAIGRSTQTAPTNQPEPLEPSEPEPQQPDQPEQQNTEEPAEDDNALLTDLSIEGRVLTRDGKTINQMPLELVLLRANNEDRQAFGNQKRQATSSESGEYVFANLVSGDYRICTTENAYYEKGCIQAHAPLQSADFALRSINGARVYGVVKNSDGQPLSGVRVSATQQKTSATSNEKGEYSFDVIVSPNRSYLFYFNKQDYERFRFSLKSEEIAGELQKDIVMERLGGVSVPINVRDESGSPIKGQRVSIYSSKVKSARPLSCSSDEAGQCIIKNANPADDYKARVKPKGPYAYKNPLSAPITVAAGMSPVTITLARTGEGTVNAQVVNVDGFPEAGIIMSLRSGSQYVGRETSDSSGYLLFEGVPAGSLRFYSDAEPKYSISGSGLKLAADQYQLDAKLVIDRGEYTQNIEVTSADGVLGGANASLTWTKDYDNISSVTRFSQNKVSDSAFGRIEFSNLGRGEHSLRVNKEGYKPISQKINVGVDAPDLSVYLEKE